MENTIIDKGNLLISLGTYLILTPEPTQITTLAGTVLVLVGTVIQKDTPPKKDKNSDV